MIADQELDKGLFNLRIVWFTMLVSLGIYLFLGFYAGASFGPLMQEEEFGKLRALLYIVSFITLIATRYIRKVLLSRKGQYHPASQTFQHPALQTYTTATIVALAMSDSIGIYGLVLFVLGRNPVDLYLLILISAGAMFMFRPKREEVVTLAGDG